MEHSVVLSVKDQNTAQTIANELHQLSPRFDHVVMLNDDESVHLKHTDDASIVDRTDFYSAVWTGAKFGAAAGLVIGFIVWAFMLTGSPMAAVSLLVGPLVGAAFGMWVAGIVGLTVVNKEFRSFEYELDRGETLLSVPVEDGDAGRLSAALKKRYPEIKVAINS